MSKGSKQKTEPWSAAKPFILGSAQNLQNTVNANQPALQANAGRINEYLPDLAERAFGEDPTIEVARGYAGDVLGGKYLTGNPYLDEIAGRTRSNVSDQVNAIFSRAGRTGASAHTGVLGRELSDSENRLRYGDYEAERNRMGQAAGLVPGLTAADAARVEPFLSATQLGSTLPYLGAQTLASGMGGLLGPYTQTTQKKSLGSTLMDAATAAAYAFSDPSLKKDAKLLDIRDDGLGVYEFKYKRRSGFDLPKGRQVGVMADEVAALRPDALGPVVLGKRMVDYAQL
jgi:hypothetical protein